MEITLYIVALQEDIAQQSHFNTLAVKDPVAQLDARVDEDKRDILERALQVSNGALKTIVGRFLKSDSTCHLDNTPGMPEAYVYDFDFAPRRAQNKAQALTSAMHDYLVHSSLNYIYNAVGQADLAAKQLDAATSAATLVKQLVYTKSEPTQW